MERNKDLNNHYSYSYLNLGECEKLLKIKYSIPSNQPLIIILINIYNSNYISTYNKGFLIYDPITKKKLDIVESCNSVDNILYFNISISPRDEANNINYTLFSRNGFNLADKNDSFYKNVCKNYTYDFNSDIPLSYRKKVFEKYIYDVCSDNCKFKEFDLNNNKVFCKCYTTYENKIKFEGRDRYNIFDKAKLNFNVLQCYKNIINQNFKLIYKNISFILLSFLLLLFIILMIIYFVRKNKSLREIVNNVMNYNKLLLKRIYEIEGRDNKSKYYINGDKQISNYYSSRNDPTNLLTRAIKDSSNRYLIIQNEAYLNQKIRKTKKNNEITKNQNCIYNNYSGPKNKSNIRIIYEKKKLNYIPDSKRNSIKKNKDNIKVKNYNNPTNNNQYLEEYSEYNIVKKIGIISKEERYTYYSDTEINLFDYEKALKIDTRNILRYYWSIIMDNDLLFYSFGFWNHKFSFTSVKLSFFIFSFNIILLINIMFMTDKNIFHLFEVEGKYIFTYYILKITLSMLISLVIILLMKLLLIEINKIFSIRYLEKDIFVENVNKIFKKVHLKNTIFFIISLILNIFIWYFVICFCLVYVNNEIILITNGLISIVEIIAYPFLFGILSAIFRYVAINDEKKSKNKLYTFNQYFEFILL